MINLIIIFFLTLPLQASMGDCFTCHRDLLPNLQADKRHIAMKTCIECHSANETPTLECGDKCFSCHTEEDLDSDEIKEHQVIQKCRECHVDAIHELFDTSRSFDQSQNESLQDFLQK
ncbi:MAG: hypothetical protein U9N33_11075 [Campylobacterota bacterium]|nr:hypothetical protein [Campylobacterota bacterium]